MNKQVTRTPATVIARKQYQSKFGGGFVTKMIGDDDTLFVSFNAGTCKVGERVIIKSARIKKRDSFRGEAQTVLTHVKLERLPAIGCALPTYATINGERVDWQNDAEGGTNVWNPHVRGEGNEWAVFAEGTGLWSDIMTFHTYRHATTFTTREAAEQFAQTLRVVAKPQDTSGWVRIVHHGVGLYCKGDLWEQIKFETSDMGVESYKAERDLPVPPALPKPADLDTGRHTRRPTRAGVRRMG